MPDNAPPAPRPRSRLRPWLVLLALLVLPALLFTLYIGGLFAFSYSEGERAGILQKFSRKGWFCKTYEGELAMSIVPGVTPTIWEFSVRDERILPRLSAAIGKRVVLHYDEHRGIPTTCFGHTPYFVDSVAVGE
ncbi:MAG TPA: hypothetical protein VEB59_11095 [Gemmatimonadales bacterium]|nr:hypothetical protein [Gemmatimonadales bacterium]